MLRDGRYGEPVTSGESVRLRILRHVMIDLRDVW